GRRAYLLLNQLEERIQKLSGGDFIAAGIGIAVAFLASLFVSTARDKPMDIIAKTDSRHLYLLLMITWAMVRSRGVVILIFSLEPNMTETSKPTLSTSVIIDGRIPDICTTGFIEGSFIIPGFVLEELQSIADSSDTLKRNRGRTGLDVLKRLQSEPRVSVVFSEDDFQEVTSVDAKLIRLAQKTNGVVDRKRR
ncbi:hypothetical protein HKBW3S25_01832, partial [Candidatus Hakubella thermalkaliphila]